MVLPVGEFGGVILSMAQVPQFLFEAGYGCKCYADRAGSIGVTQPRRVAAIASAQRVAAEMDSRVGDVVGYQVCPDLIVDILEAGLSRSIRTISTKTAACFSGILRWSEKSGLVVWGAGEVRQEGGE